MNIERTNLKQTNEAKTTSTQNSNNNKTSIKFEEELKELESKELECKNASNIDKTDDTKLPTDADIAENLNETNEENKMPEKSITEIEIQKINNKIGDFSEKSNNLDKAVSGLNTIVNELKQVDSNKTESPISKDSDKPVNIFSKDFNQTDDKIFNPVKKNEGFVDNNDMINNDFNIQENKEILPQMSPNMNFSGDGQPFSSFMNEENKTKEKKLIINAAELAEEAAILSTMAENIAIANKNQILNEESVVSTSKIKPVEIKTVINEEGIKRVEAESGIKIENIVKFDNIVMNEADVELFANLVEKGEVDLKSITSESVNKSVQVSKTLADMLVKCKESNQPLRIDFDNDISIIIRISRDGKISADFLPSSQVAEAYLRENLPILRQKFDDSNIKYDELNQKERKDSNKEQNRRKGRNDE